MTYTSLHTHSEYSKDGAGRLETLVEKAKQLNWTHLALTDHGTMSGAVQFYLACKEQNITPIFGLEGYLSLDLNKNDTNHITLLSYNKVGFDNLIRLNNRSHEQMKQRGSIKTPRITLEDMDEFSEGMIALTGCPVSLTYHEKFQIAYNYVETLSKIYGKDKTFAELMFSLEGHDFHTRPLKLAKELGVEIVVTNDTHFPEKGDHDVHMICNRIRARASSGYDYTYDSKRLWLLSQTEVAEFAIPEIGEETFTHAVKNVSKITEMVEPFSMEKEPFLPPVDEEELVKFKQLVKKKFVEYLVKKPEKDRPEIQKRFDKEWSVITDFGYWQYFYIVNDIIYFVLKHGRYVTVRGSAGGALLAYLLDWYSVDPVKYGLLFERFLNTARHDFPDVDIDVDSIFKDEVVKYCEERWNMRQVNTSLTFTHRSLVNDLFSMLPEIEDVDYEVKEQLSSLGEDSEQFQKFCEEYPEFKKAYYLMLDQQKTVGTHAAAMASIGETLVPVEMWGNSPGIAWSESGAGKKDLSTVGGIKFDILGVLVLHKLYLMEQYTGVKPPTDPEEDLQLKVFQSGNTLGIFQYDGSEGIIKMCREVHPDTFDELITINSMYRPGALDAGTAEHYTWFKKSPRSFHEDIDELLAPTHSVFVFQEQVMQVYAQVTGTGLEGADLARRVLSPKSAKMLDDPKWKKQVREVKREFYKLGSDRGYSNNLLDNLWKEMLTHSRYSFNKSHSAAYADIARKQAWYKVHYPLQYFRAIMNAYLADGKDGPFIQDYLLEVFRDGIKLRAPHIKYSSTIFEDSEDELYLPLQLVAHLTQKEVDALNYLKCRINGEKYIGDIDPEFVEKFDQAYDKYGPFDELTFEALSLMTMGHTWKSTVKQNLWGLGGYDGVAGDPEWLDKTVVYKSGNITDKWKQYTESIQGKYAGMSRQRIQIATMKLVVPDKELMRKLDKRSDFVRGILIKETKKKTKSGINNLVYHLTGKRYLRMNLDKGLKLPTGLDGEKIPIGTPIAALVNNQYGYIEEDKKRKKFKVGIILFEGENNA